MRRVKIIKDYRDYRKGETIEVTPNVAHGLIDAGVAELTKDMASSEIRTKNGYTSKLRSNKSK